MAYKVFTNGSVLQASEVNENLMNQAVITFTNSTARASAITSPVEGMVTYLADTDTYQFWNGSAWTNLVSSTVGTGNAIINGAFEINQRNFTSSTNGSTYTFDRWKTNASGGTFTYSAQALSPNDIKTDQFELRNFMRLVVSGQGAGNFASVNQLIENVTTFAGQTITISFYAKASAGGLKLATYFGQFFGSGGSSTVFTYGTAITATTSWARYSITMSVPTLAGKTIGTGSYLDIGISASDAFNTNLGAQAGTFDITGVQVEAGSTATAFRRNANSLQGELAACQRYYWRVPASQSAIGTGSINTATASDQFIKLPVTMRANVSSIETSNLLIGDGLSAAIAYTGVVLSGGNLDSLGISGSHSSVTTGRFYTLRTGASGFLGVSAEL